MPPQIPHDQAAKSLLQQTAREAAVTFRKEKPGPVVRTLGSLFSYLNTLRIQRNCQKDRHVISEWKTTFENQKIYGRKAVVGVDLPIGYRNTYIGKCMYCQKPHLLILNF